MPPIKLHKWYFAAILLFVITTSCSNKSMPQKTIENTAIEIPVDYSPPTFIVVANDKVKTNAEGELYYDNEYGYRYWKRSDGKFYLDENFKKKN
jgi:hypothetical protein